MSLQVEFGKRVKQYRLIADLSQLELGLAIDLSERQVRNIEKGIHPTDISRVERIASALKVPARELFPE
jgi:transcriptional regulator with XRE-family HTH domain